MKAYVSADNAVNPSDPWGAYDDNTVIETEDEKNLFVPKPYRPGSKEKTTTTTTPRSVQQNQFGRQPTPTAPPRVIPTAPPRVVTFLPQVISQIQPQVQTPNQSPLPVQPQPIRPRTRRPPVRPPTPAPFPPQQSFNVPQSFQTSQQNFQTPAPFNVQPQFPTQPPQPAFPQQFQSPPTTPAPQLPFASQQNLRTGVCPMSIFYISTPISGPTRLSFTHFAIAVTVDQCARTCHEFNCAVSCFLPGG
ncbi:unnamed protein product [Heligmosomoides polygyrus]|uniref:Extensin-like n=1 Tax=Heligmosomoides polygyrus TaxID=6339 RepID=A0A183GS03_HELPZ|nr:unnamed protein product [Heligmosomoides polygyrus]